MFIFTFELFYLSVFLIFWIIFYYFKFTILYPFVYFPLWFWSRWIGGFKRWRFIRQLTIVWVVVAFLYALFFLMATYELMPGSIVDLISQYGRSPLKAYETYSIEHPFLSKAWPALFLYSCMLLYGSVIYVPIILWLQRKEGWLEETLNWLRTCKLKKPSKDKYKNIIFLNQWRKKDSDEIS